MIFDGALAAAGDQDQLVESGVDDLLHDVLDDRRVDDRHHLLRQGLGCRKEPGSKPRGRDDGFAGATHELRSRRSSASWTGHTLVVSAYQFQVRPVNVSPGLLALETGEVPAEYRLLFDAPLLAAYRYAARPFNLQLALSPLAQGETLSLVVDRAALNTRISKDGEVITDVRYYVKNRGNTHFRVTVPAGVELWSATVNGTTVVPVKDGAAHLIPLPPRADPNAVQALELKLAARAKNAGRLTVSAPAVAAPVLLADWKLEPDAGQRLVFRAGSLAPVGGVADVSGFAGLVRLLTGWQRGRAAALLVASVALTLLGVGSWRWACGHGVFRNSPRHLLGRVVGVLAWGMAGVALVVLGSLLSADVGSIPRNLSFLAPVQQSGSRNQSIPSRCHGRWKLTSFPH